eukprot:TRINITY_DN47222_c0_g1_i1.p1 TRINITY_DN47222_c0_g1~~TRINITY_DN47222_c0_g1_i1.p1  ORF type:complete len:319 (+),score=94.70 TRINITY_DN47222_c0_g1_i1:79-957(+)
MAAPRPARRSRPGVRRGLLRATALGAAASAAAAVAIAGGGRAAVPPDWVPLAQLGPTLQFARAVQLTVAGRPGEPRRNVSQMHCEGWHCDMLPVTSVSCSHDPASSEDMVSLMWACREEVAEDEARVLDGGHGTSDFSFRMRRVECDSNISASTGLAVVGIDTGNVTLPFGVAPGAEERVYVIPSTCRLTYTIVNHGSPQEKWSLMLILIVTIMFVLVAICPSGNWWTRESTVGRIDPTHLPPPVRNAPGDQFSLGALRRRGVPRTTQHRPGDATIAMPSSHSNTFPIDGTW